MKPSNKPHCHKNFFEFKFDLKFSEKPKKKKNFFEPKQKKMKNALDLGWPELFQWAELKSIHTHTHHTQKVQ